MKPRERERERERHHLGREDDAISDGGECSTPPALRPPTDVICKVFSQLDCVDLLTCSLVCNWLRKDPSTKKTGSVNKEGIVSLDHTGWYLVPHTIASVTGTERMQWYRDSSELREGWKSEYMEAAMFCSGIKRDVHPPSSTCSIKGLHSNSTEIQS